MALQPFPVEQFGGIDLKSDPTEIGPTRAADLLNVDFGRLGGVRTRDGFDNFTSSTGTNRYRHLFPFYRSSVASASQQIVATRTNSLDALDTGGALVSAQAFTGTVASAARIGTTSTEFLYVPTVDGTGTVTVYRWSGSAWTAPAGMAPGMLYAASSIDNRLVSAGAVAAAVATSKVAFSDPGLPETWGANNFVHLAPGDGEQISALVAWRELVFAFKQSKFFVFTGTSTAGDGNPVFNYRPVTAGIGVPGPVSGSAFIKGGQAVAGSDGVYFLNQRGIYRTIGGEPQLVSRPLDPLFSGDLPVTYTGSAINMGSLDAAALAWVDERLFVAVPTGVATVNDRLLVWDKVTDSWSIWDIPAAGMASFSTSSPAINRLFFSYASGSNHVGQVSSAFTNDDGSNIASRWQSGFFNMSEVGADVFTRWTRLWGSGTPTVSMFTDMGSTDSTASAVTLGTAPAVAEAYRNVSYKGRLFSHKISATSGAWSVSRLQHDIASVRM